MPSVSDDESSRQVARVASTSLPSIASRSGNIDISQQGSVALQTEEAIYILVSTMMLRYYMSCLTEPSLRRHQL